MFQKTFYKGRVCLLIVVLFFVLLSVPGNTQALTLEESHQVATLYARLSGLKGMLERLTQSLYRGGFAQVSGTTPGVPTGVTASWNSSPGEVVINWTDASTNETTFQIERRFGTAGTWSQVLFLTSGSSADTGFARTHRDPNTSPGAWDYKVKACNDSGCGESTYMTVTVGTGTTGGTTTTSSCSSSLTALLGSGCHFMYTDSAGRSIYCDTSMTISAKEGDTATTSGCSSSTSSTPSTTLNTVNNLTATYRSASNDVELRWTDSSVGEDEYKIWRRTTGGSFSSLSSKTRPYDDGSPITYYDSAPPSGVSLEYMIKACTTSGSCAASDSNIGYVTVGTPGGTTTTTNCAGLYGTGWHTMDSSGTCFDTNMQNYRTVNGTLYSCTSTPASGCSTGVGTTTTTSCSSSLVALLGSGCHFMYTDSTSRSIYCDGPMTKSAKEGDTVATTGCSSSTTNTVATAVVGDLRATYRNISNDVELAWTDTAIGEDEYRIQRRATGGSLNYLAAKTRPYNDGGTINYYDSGLVSNTSYEYIINACTFSGTCSIASSNTAYVTVGTLSTGACSNALLALLGTDCHYMFPDSTGNRIFCNGPMTKSAKEGDTVAATGCSAPGGGATIPVAPANLTAVQSQSDALLTWNDNSTNENEYKVERRTTGGTSWVFVGSTGIVYGGSGTYRDYYPPSGSYDYRVKACNSAGCSADSNIMLLVISSVSTIAQCSDGRDNDADGFIDFPADKSCYDGTDNDEFYPSSQTADCSSITAQSTCTGTSGCQWNVPSTSSGAPYCSMVYAGDTTSCPGFAYSKWDSQGRRYCQLNRYVSCQYNYPQYLDAKNYDPANCSVGVGVSQCSDGRDNDGDGLIDYPSDTGCYSRDDNDETVPVVGIIPSTPSGLTAVMSSNGYDIILRWNDNATNESEYKIWRRIGTNSWSFLVSIGIAYGGIVTHTDLSMPAGYTGLIDYRVQACNSSGCSPDSNTASVNVGTVTTVIYPFTFPSGKSCTSYQACFDYCKTTPGSGTGDPATCEKYFPGSTTVVTPQCSDGRDNDADGFIDYPQDPSCYDRTDNDEFYPQTTPQPTGCDSALIALLGSGCHQMYTDFSGNQVFCNGNMTISAKRGATAVTPGCQFNAPPVPTTFSVDPYSTYPRDQESGVDTLIRVRVNFTRDIDPASTIAQFFSLASVSSPGTVLNGTFQFFGSGFEFVPALLLDSNTTYIYKVFTTLKDKSGAILSSPLTRTFTTVGGVSANATIEGLVLDAADSVLSGISVNIYKENFASNISTVSAADGSFRAVVSPGTYWVEAYTPSLRSDLLRPTPVKVAVASGLPTKVTVKFNTITTAAKAITGTVKFSNGSAVTDAEVSAYSGDTYQWISASPDAVGGYTLRVAGGKWKIGIRPKNPATASWSYSGPYPEASFARDNAVEFRIADFVVPVADATLNISTLDGQGKPLAGVGVVVDILSAGQSSLSSGISGENRAAPQYRSSDANGLAKFTLVSGRYHVRAYFPPDKGYINPQEKEATVTSGKVTDLSLTFFKRDTSVTLPFKGVIKLEDGIPTDAFIWAWAEKGGYISTFSSAAGLFEFKVGPNERWHIGAGKVVGGIPYKASEVVVDVKDVAVNVELILAKLDKDALPPPVVIKESATKQVVAQAEDGAKAIVPPNAAGYSGNISVEVKPTVEAPSQAGAQVVGTAYDVTIHDAAGKSVTTLNSDAEIVIPYAEAELKAQGITEDDLIPSFFDEKTGAWVKVDNYTIDKEKNVVILRVNHLTRFGLVASADTTPPAPPTKGTVSALGEGKVKITWQNPVSDFSYAKVYRSDQQDELGKIVAPQVKGNQYLDNSVADGVTYYYTVRSTDPAGNESNNKDQVSVKAVGTSAQVSAPGKAISAVAVKKGALARNLSQGARGDDVKSLQELLIKEGLLPVGSTSGFFGKLTREAVIKFQEKYASDVLKPAGLSKGNGFIGPGTRKKMNELLGK